MNVKESSDAQLLTELVDRAAFRQRLASTQSERDKALVAREAAIARTESAFRSRRHVVVEVPPCMTAAEAERLVREWLGPFVVDGGLAADAGAPCSVTVKMGGGIPASAPVPPGGRWRGDDGRGATVAPGPGPECAESPATKLPDEIVLDALLTVVQSVGVHPVEDRVAACATILDELAYHPRAGGGRMRAASWRHWRTWFSMGPARRPPASRLVGPCSASWNGTVGIRGADQIPICPGVG